MDAKERQEVSARMTQYWASRRAQKSDSEATQSAGG
jgi:hypothetical protein